MLLVKSITPKKINKLYLKPTALSAVFIAFLTAFQGQVAHGLVNGIGAVGLSLPTINTQMGGDDVAGLIHIGFNQVGDMASDL